MGLKKAEREIRGQRDARGDVHVRGKPHEEHLVQPRVRALRGRDGLDAVPAIVRRAER